MATTQLLELRKTYKVGIKPKLTAFEFELEINIVAIDVKEDSGMYTYRIVYRNLSDKQFAILDKIVNLVSSKTITLDDLSGTIL